MTTYLSLKMLYKTLRKLIPNSVVKKLAHKLGVSSQKSSFVRLKQLGFDPKHILDIGAYEGNWAAELHDIFPAAKILMIEGQKSKKTLIEERTKHIPNSTIEIALLGAKEEDVEFNMYESASSVYKEDNETNAKVESIKLQLLDNVVTKHSFEQVDLIKIDTQGYELEILKGGISVLKSAQFVLLEVSLLGIYKNAPLVDEVILFMKSNNFLLYDICTLMRRPYDNAVFQSDFLFVKADHPLRISTRWD